MFLIKQFCYLHNHSYLKAYSYILALYNMLIKTITDILNHQSDRFDLLLRPSYSPLFLCNAFRRFPLIPFVYFTHPKKRQTQRNHAIK